LVFAVVEGVRTVAASAADNAAFRQSLAMREAQDRVELALGSARGGRDTRSIQADADALAQSLLASARAVAELSASEATGRVLSETWLPRDTWRSFASRYGLSPDALARLNPGVRRDAVRAGDRLIIYTPDADRRSLSVGRASGGRLVHGIPMPDGEFWTVRERETSYGTETTIEQLVAGLNAVGRAMPGGTKLLLGDVSRPSGRRLPPHRSHQSGRDADLGYYIRGQQSQRVFQYASRQNLDAARQWALIRHWLESGSVERIFMDHRLQATVFEYALGQGESREFLEEVFQYPGWNDAIISHAPGHADHLHVRFRCDEWDAACKRAEETPVVPVPAKPKRVTRVAVPAWR
jgi:murein endopeptidase